MNVDFFGLLYVAVLISGTGVMQVVGIVLAIRTWIDRQKPAPELGFRESLLLSNDSDNDQMNSGHQSTSSRCNV